MKKENSHLIIKQLDKKYLRCRGIEELSSPKGGWLQTMRQLLNISLEPMGKKLKVSPQAVKAIELREAAGTVTIKTLSKAAEAMDMNLVYVFVPKDKLLEKLIERKAREIAQKIVMRSSVTMKLEDQANTTERIQEAIEEVTAELKRTIPGSLWD